MAYTSVREEELLFVLRHLVTMTLWPGSIKSDDQGAVASALSASPRAHLLRYYPLLLELAFVDRVPSMWILPSEHAQLFGRQTDVGDRDADARDGSELIEVSARDLARRALEIVGEELALGTSSSVPPTPTQ